MNSSTTCITCGAGLTSDKSPRCWHCRRDSGETTVAVATVAPETVAPETVPADDSDVIRPGFRMVDVRVRITEAGGGLRGVELLKAGSYVVTTRDGREWNLYRSLPARLWYGELR